MSRPTERKPAPTAPEQPATSFVAELKAVSPALVLVPLALTGWLLYGALNHIEKNKHDAVGWAPADFSNLAWLALFGLVAVFIAGLRRKLPGTLTMVAVAGMLMFAAAVGSFGNAWATERQNYWDAYHFAVLFWLAAGSAVMSLVSTVVGGRRGSPTCKALQGPALVCVLVSVVAWMWTWNPWFQSIEGWIARSFFLATHN